VQFELVSGAVPCCAHHLCHLGLTHMRRLRQPEFDFGTKKSAAVLQPYPHGLHAMLRRVTSSRQIIPHGLTHQRSLRGPSLLRLPPISETAVVAMAAALRDAAMPTTHQQGQCLAMRRHYTPTHLLCLVRSMALIS